MKSCFFIGHREASEDIFPKLMEAVENHIVDYDKMTGKPKRVSKYAKTREEAVKLLNQMPFMNDTSPNNFTRVTLGDWLDLCLEVYMKNTIKQSTYASTEEILKKD